MLHSLMQDLRDGRYERGERLPAERVLAQALGVSRPIIREALHALDLLGVVETRVGSGTYVVDAHRDLGNQVLHASAFEVLGTLSTLECSALFHAAGLTDKTLLDALAERLEEAIRADADFESWHHGLAEFHVTLAKAGGNEVLNLMIGQLWQVRLGTSTTHSLVQRAWLAGSLADHETLRRLLAALQATTMWRAGNSGPSTTGSLQRSSTSTPRTKWRALANPYRSCARDSCCRLRDSGACPRAGNPGRNTGMAKAHAFN
ncbi:FadR/GntR family transcriptional regulator [Novosphingobium resinovorum]